ncbi:hypothetical protein [Colwellia sp. RSH04]|uniref:hypothetical protein n=1 Tax=Colwellia sp. RSH04 TaxID=2305464 RepID=UPI0015F8B719|nr:hypothetical protein [Colwellia sp. RSH04]
MKLHIGDFLAWAVRVLWLVLRLLPCFFVISGMQLNRLQAITGNASLTTIRELKT